MPLQGFIRLFTFNRLLRQGSKQPPAAEYTAKDEPEPLVRPLFHDLGPDKNNRGFLEWLMRDAN